MSRKLRISILLPIAIVVLLSCNLALTAFAWRDKNPWYRIDFISGSSMEPAINHNDLIIFLPQADKLEPGMIILFQNPDGINILHRILEITEDGCLLTKGDNNFYIDYSLTPDGKGFRTCQSNVKGRYVGKIPLLGAAVRFLRNLSAPRTE